MKGEKALDIMPRMRKPQWTWTTLPASEYEAAVEYARTAAPHRGRFEVYLTDDEGSVHVSLR